MPPAPPGTEVGIREPHPHDVLKGKGKGVHYHPGNVAFRAVVEKYRPDYKGAGRGRRKDISMMICRTVRELNPPGRFLKKKDDDLWYEIGESEALEKARQALSEKPKPRKDSEPSEKEDPITNSPTGSVNDQTNDIIAQTAPTLVLEENADHSSPQGAVSSDDLIEENDLGISLSKLQIQKKQNTSDDEVADVVPDDMEDLMRSTQSISLDEVNLNGNISNGDSKLLMSETSRLLLSSSMVADGVSSCFETKDGEKSFNVSEIFDPNAQWNAPGEILPEGGRGIGILRLNPQMKEVSQLDLGLSCNHLSLGEPSADGTTSKEESTLSTDARPDRVPSSDELLDEFNETGTQSMFSNEVKMKDETMRRPHLRARTGSQRSVSFPHNASGRSLNVSEVFHHPDLDMSRGTYGVSDISFADFSRSRMSPRNSLLSVGSRQRSNNSLMLSETTRRGSASTQRIQTPDDAALEDVLRRLRSEDEFHQMRHDIRRTSLHSTGTTDDCGSYMSIVTDKDSIYSTQSSAAMSWFGRGKRLSTKLSSIRDLEEERSGEIKD